MDNRGTVDLRGLWDVCKQEMAEAKEPPKSETTESPANETVQASSHLRKGLVKVQRYGKDKARNVPFLIRLTPECKEILDWMEQHASEVGLPFNLTTKSEILRIALRYTYINWAAIVASCPKWI